MIKPTIWVSDQAVQSQKMARGCNFWIWKVKELFYRVAETKALISFAVTAKLICAFDFAYTDCWFSYAVAQMSLISG